MNQSKIGNFIKELRKEKELTQKDIATKLGVTNKAVSKWENGLCLPDYSMIKELCDILDVSINELLSGERLNQEEYQKRFEENVLKSINYKVKKNNHKAIKITLIVIVLITLIGVFGSRIWHFYYNDLSTIIKMRKLVIKNTEVIYKNDEVNDLANTLVLDNNLAIYIPEGYKYYDDLEKSKTVFTVNGCYLFMKNYDDELSKKTQSAKFDSYILICHDDSNYSNARMPEFVNYYKKHKVYDNYDVMDYAFKMKDVNVFSNISEMAGYQSTAEMLNYSEYSIRKLYMFKRDNIKSYFEIIKPSSDSNLQYVVYAGNITEKILDGSYDNPKYNDLDKEYNIFVYDKAKTLTEEDVVNIFESVKVRGEYDIEKLLGE